MLNRRKGIDVLRNLAWRASDSQVCYARIVWRFLFMLLSSLPAFIDYREPTVYIVDASVVLSSKYLNIFKLAPVFFFNSILLLQMECSIKWRAFPPVTPNFLLWNYVHSSLENDAIDEWRNRLIYDHYLLLGRSINRSYCTHIEDNNDIKLQVFVNPAQITLQVPEFVLNIQDIYFCKSNYIS